MNILSFIGTSVKNHVATHKGVVRIIDTKNNITTRSSDPIGTTALATDTEDLLLYIGGGTWVKIQTETIT
jgi:hypothetical protein